MRGRRTGMVAVVVLAACGIEPELEHLEETSAALSTCPDWGCGANSASLGQGIAFHELDASGRYANDVGVRITSFTSARGAPLTLVVDGDELRGVERGGTVRRGRALNGAILRLEHPTSRFSLRIDDVSETEYWTGIRADVPTYLFRYREDGGRDAWLPICEGLGLVGDPVWGSIRQIALVFRGDRYDAVHKTVIATGAATGQWFNVACAGSVPAKVHLMRHTDAGSDATHVSTALQRQAMVKMLTADYCGRGLSFTEDGQPLIYGDAGGWLPIDTRLVRTYESIWDADGAVCLNTPRRLFQVPGLLDHIRRECGGLPPPCGAWLGAWTRHGYALSANP